MCKSDKIKAGAWDEITAMSREAVDVMLGLELGHIGINCADEAEAAKTAETIANLLSMAVKVGNSSIFVGKKEFEIMKKPGRGTNGHIAILTNNVDRAIYTWASAASSSTWTARTSRTARPSPSTLLTRSPALPSIWSSADFGVKPPVNL